MIRNYLKVAIRNLVKQKFYSLINILGLAVGITCSLLIMLFVMNEYSYDKFHHKSSRIYRVVLKARMAGNDFSVPVVSAPFAHTVKNEFTEVEQAVRLFPLRNEVTRFEDKVFNVKKAYFVDSTFFDVFDFALIEGNLKTALKEKHSVVLSKDLAQKYFGNESAIGKELVIGDFDSHYLVTGVIENCPANSHFRYNMLMSMSSFEPANDQMWVNNNYFTYLVLKDGRGALQNMDKQLSTLVEKYFGPQLESIIGISPKEFLEQGNSFGYYLQPLEDIHLHSTLEGEMEQNGNIEYVYVLVAIGIFIILLACINFMNLATARSTTRVKEVGVRKALGSERKLLVAQFLTESVCYAIFATVLAVIFVDAILPYFNSLAGKELKFSVLYQPEVLTMILCFTVVVGLLAGSYPALYLSSFNVVEIIKGKLSLGLKSSGLRSSLVVFQFFVSIVLIICTLVVYRQLNFIKDKELGFDKENVVVINNTNRLGNSFEAFRNNILSRAEVINVSSSNGLPADPDMGNTVFRPEGSNLDHLITFFYADYEYLNTLNIELKEGRFFSKDLASDSAAIVMNEAAIRYLGYDSGGVGKQVRYFGRGEGGTMLNIIGVFKDYHFESFTKPIKPIAILLRPQSYMISVRFNPGNLKAHIHMLEEEWKKVVTDAPFEYSFLDEKFYDLFKAEQKLSEVFTLFTGLAIFIACLGLFGLAAYTAQQKTKEIGVRKVFGASYLDIVLMMTKDFTKLVLIAFVLAVPIAYFAMEKWLQNFVYKTEIGAGIFVIAALFITLIAWITVSFQSAKAALSDPVKSLKTE